jgi:transcriptional regulator with XRE-family HTH domain/tetratricopeptide (TPR) repeat protein
MLADEHTYGEIAAEFALRWGFRPRQAWRHAYGWSQVEVADRYNQLRDDDQAPMTGRRISDYENWPYSGKKPTHKTLSMLAKIYSTSPLKLVDHDERQKMSAEERIELEPPRPSAPTEGDINPNGNDQFNRSQLPSVPPFAIAQTSAQQSRTSSSVVVSVRQSFPQSIRDQIMSAADESQRHAENSQGYAMSEATLDEITAEVERLTKEHLYSDSLSTFSHTVQVRNRIYRLLERRQYPRQAEHLYYLASIACALLAGESASFGFSRAAWEQARASWAYAEIVGHNSLRFESRIRQASLAYWENRPQTALELAGSATPWATESIAQVSLHNSIALFSALTARPRDARTALVAAFDAHEASMGNSELYDHLGGMFSYSRAKLLQVSAITYLALDDLDHAEENTAEAVRLYENGPAELRAFGNEASARIDLGHARLLRGDAEGAEDALRPVLNLPPSRRLDWVGSRLKDFHNTLRTHNIATAPLGRQLGLEIEEFFEATASSNFPNANGY